jgi:hypothetical protein
MKLEGAYQVACKYSDIGKGAFFRQLGYWQLEGLWILVDKQESCKRFGEHKLCSIKSSDVVKPVAAPVAVQ